MDMSTGYSETGVYHYSIAEPKPVFQGAWTLKRSLKVSRFRSAQAPRQSDEKVIAENTPSTVRQAILHFLAGGGSLKASDIKKLVFGSHLSSKVGGDIHPSFWKQHTERGRPFDLFCKEHIPFLLGFDSAFFEDEAGIQRELEDILQGAPSKTSARRMLAEEYRAHYYADCPF